MQKVKDLALILMYLSLMVMFSFTAYGMVYLIYSDDVTEVGGDGVRCYLYKESISCVPDIILKPKN